MPLESVNLRRRKKKFYTTSHKEIQNITRPLMKYLMLIFRFHQGLILLESVWNDPSDILFVKDFFFLIFYKHWNTQLFRMQQFPWVIHNHPKRFQHNESSYSHNNSVLQLEERVNANGKAFFQWCFQRHRLTSPGRGNQCNIIFSQTKEKLLHREMVITGLVHQSFNGLQGIKLTLS